MTRGFKQFSISVRSLVKPPSINVSPVFVCVETKNIIHIRRLAIFPVVIVRVAVCLINVGTPTIERRGASGRRVIIMGTYKGGSTPFDKVPL